MAELDLCGEGTLFEETGDIAPVIVFCQRERHDTGSHLGQWISKTITWPSGKES